MLYEEWFKKLGIFTDTEEEKDLPLWLLRESENQLDETTGSRFELGMKKNFLIVSSVQH